MKAIFRGVLIMKFTDNSENISVESLRDYMKEHGKYNEECKFIMQLNL